MMRQRHVLAVGGTELARSGVATPLQAARALELLLALMSTGLVVIGVGGMELASTAAVTQPSLAQSIPTMQARLAVVAVGGTENATSAVAAESAKAHQRHALTSTTRVLPESGPAAGSTRHPSLSIQTTCLEEPSRAILASCQL